MTFCGRRPLVDEDFRWMMTFGGRQHLVEEDIWWKTTFSGRRPSLDPCMLPTPLCGIFCVMYNIFWCFMHRMGGTYYFRTNIFGLFVLNQKKNPKKYDKSLVKYQIHFIFYENFPGNSVPWQVGFSCQH